LAASQQGEARQFVSEARERASVTGEPTTEELSGAVPGWRFRSLMRVFNNKSFRLCLLQLYIPPLPLRDAIKSVMWSKNQRILYR